MPGYYILYCPMLVQMSYIPLNVMNQGLPYMTSLRNHINPNQSNKQSPIDVSTSINYLIQKSVNVQWYCWQVIASNISWPHFMEG